MKKILFPIVIIALLMSSSCTSVKKLTYLQDMQNLHHYTQEDVPAIRIQCDDKLSISVSCKNPELAIPFNINNGTGAKVSSDGDVSISGNANSSGYRVNKEGCIDFPILGELKVVGLTLQELKHKIEQEIIQSNYIKEPLVSVELLNFQITILGEVSKKGNFAVPDNNLNLFEAIAMAGDLNNTAMRSEVLVIRTENGQRTVYPHDLLSKTVYDSPAFYLQQNDIVYVKPNKSKSDGSNERFLSIFSTVLSVVTAACAVGYLIIR